MSGFSRRLRRAGHATQTVGNGLSSDPYFFPVTVWLQTPESNAANFAALGVNTFIGLWDGFTTSNIAALSANGMYAIADQDSTALGSSLGPSVVRGWSQVDEPDNAQSDGQGGYGPAVPVATIVNNYNSWKAADTLKRPVYLNFSRAVGDPSWIGIGYDPAERETIYTQYAAGADIVGFDVYPVNSGLPLRDVANGVDNLRRWTNYQKPVFFWVECTKYDSSNVGTPTPAQVKCEVWLGLTHGANGYGFFCHIFTPTFAEAGVLGDTAMKNAITALNTQVHSLAPVLNSPTISSGATRSNSLVHIIVKRYGGFTYLCAVSESSSAQTCTFTITGVSSATAIVDGESRSLAVTAGQFTDTFVAYAVHIYKIG